MLNTMRVCAAVCAVAWAVPAFAQKDDSTPPLPVVGMSHPIEVVPDLDAAGITPGGGVWRETVFVKDATFLKAHIVNMNLKDGDELILTSASGKEIERLTSRGPKDWGTFWALSAFGDELNLEFRFTHRYDVLPFRIDQIILGNTDLFDQTDQSPESICSPPDFEDVICYQGDADKWDNIFASVGVMSLGGNPNSALFCSGSNVSPLNYVLTNDHCISSQSSCNNAEFVFKYYRTQCGGGQPTNDWQSFRCDQIVASSPFSSCDQGLNDLDFALCSVIGDPSATFGHVDPDPVPITDGEGIYIVQHPAGRPHEITHGSGSDVDADGTVLRYYRTLDTEGGSSGSPIYRESDDMLIGLHHCGGCSTAGVGNRGMLMSDIYPHIVNYICSQDVDIKGDGFESLTEVSGNGDAALDPGEIWSILPKVKNLACSVDGLGVTADIQVNLGSEPINLLDTFADFGDVLAGGSSLANSPIRFEIDASADCGAPLILDLVNIVATNGGPFDDDLGFFQALTGAEPIDVLFSEDFSSGLGAWTIKDNGGGSGPAQTWTTSNPGGRGLALTAPFSICDSDRHGNFRMNEKLISPVVDCSGYSIVRLQYSYDFNWFSGNRDEQGDVSVRSSATGGNWTNVANYSRADSSGTVTLDISAFAGGQTDVEIRFWYRDAESEWWWAVDDVFLLGTNGFECADPSFLQYGTGCAGGGGNLPDLDGSGNPTPGGSVNLDLSGAAANAIGFLFLSGAQDLSGGCWLVAPPFSGPFVWVADPSGDASLTIGVPVNAPTGVHVYLQWLGDDGPGALSFSNGLDIFVE